MSTEKQLPSNFNNDPIEVVNFINDEVEEMDGDGALLMRPFRYETDGQNSCIKFLGFGIWYSDEDLRETDI